MKRFNYDHTGDSQITFIIENQYTYLDLLALLDKTVLLCFCMVFIILIESNFSLMKINGFHDPERVPRAVPVPRIPGILPL